MVLIVCKRGIPLLSLSFGFIVKSTLWGIFIRIMRSLCPRSLKNLLLTSLIANRRSDHSIWAAVIAKYHVVWRLSITRLLKWKVLWIHRLRSILLIKPILFGSFWPRGSSCVCGSFHRLRVFVSLRNTLHEKIVAQLAVLISL